ncbi:head-tail adaptor protein [Roseibium algae]|uniref:Head-tail adaptor protein n=1 Tax=Roseibium algae TaxID=3123038 RepID=A0ABU8TJE2_9HYPH
MSAGLYRHPVTLQQPVHTVAADGSAALIYAEAGDDFAAIRPLRQGERQSGGRLEGVITHEIRLRHRDDLAGGWQVISGARSFRVLSTFETDGTAREITCLSEEEDT